MSYFFVKCRSSIRCLALLLLILSASSFCATSLSSRSRSTLPNIGFLPRSQIFSRRYSLYSSHQDLEQEAWSLGAPTHRPPNGSYLSQSGVEVSYEVDEIENPHKEIENIIDHLDNHRGVLLRSSYDYPGRYARWTVGFCTPALQIDGCGLAFNITALNARGKVLAEMILAHLRQQPELFELHHSGAPSHAPIHAQLSTDISSSNSDGRDSLNFGGDKSSAQFSVFSGHVLTSSAQGRPYFPEEERSRQPSLFSLVRAVRDVFSSEQAGQLGLYGALGYDLAFQFEPVPPAPGKQRGGPGAHQQHRDLVLFLPDEVLVVDNQKNDAWRVRYEFTAPVQQPSAQAGVGADQARHTVPEPEQISTVGIARSPSASPYQGPGAGPVQERDTAPGTYAEAVRAAQEQFRVGNLFEVVLSQIFRRAMHKHATPATIFRRLSKRNPSPYGFFMNLGLNEYLVGASPEMFVRVEYTGAERAERARKTRQAEEKEGEHDSTLVPGRAQGRAEGRFGSGLRVETCPISGTIERGSDALEDAAQIRKLLDSAKEESELTMCTDVDRNDKSRICVEGSVRVLGRRQIELYSRLIHTVDHVEGYLRQGFDALDAFLCHTWAVTVTGAPKTWALRFIERTETGVRHWYGGAVGFIGMDGSLNTGLTLRTIRVKDGVAEVRAGATLLHDSDPSAEEAETELKASAMLDAIVRADPTELPTAPSQSHSPSRPAAATGTAESSGGREKKAPRVLLIDHEDSFVHTLANYLRQAGAQVLTCRSGAPLQQLIDEQVDRGSYRPDLVVLSPGPGAPRDFGISETIDLLVARKLPLFGVCLGMQGLVEHFGGSLGVLHYPMHGKPSSIRRLFPDQNHTDAGCPPGSSDTDAVGTSAQTLARATGPGCVQTAGALAGKVLTGDILAGLPLEFEVARYHSLYGMEDEHFPPELVVTAVTTSEELGLPQTQTQGSGSGGSPGRGRVVMAVQHRSLPLAAVQFHPESILTLPRHGLKILANALRNLKSSMYDQNT